jgi:hypothetical protein
LLFIFKLSLPVEFLRCGHFIHGIHPHFLRGELILGSLFSILQEVREVRDPAGGSEEVLISPRGKQVPHAEMNAHYYRLKQLFVRKTAT